MPRTAKPVPCPRCLARPGRDCISARIPSANSYGGGWGGATTARPHAERQQVRRDYEARRIAARAVQS